MWKQSVTKRIPRLLEWIEEERKEALTEWLNNGAISYYNQDSNGLDKPEGLGSELADIIMIVLDIAEGLDIDIQGEIAAKFLYNTMRQYTRDAKGNQL